MKMLAVATMLEELKEIQARMLTLKGRAAAGNLNDDEKREWAIIEKRRKEIEETEV